jgi:hypothetical protein
VEYDEVYEDELEIIEKDKDPDSAIERLRYEFFFKLWVLLISKWPFVLLYFALKC